MRPPKGGERWDEPAARAKDEYFEEVEAQEYVPAHTRAEIDTEERAGRRQGKEKTMARLRQLGCT